MSIRNKKYCYNCCEVLPVYDFHKNKTTHDGLQSFCKQCKSNLAKSYHIENRERQNFVTKKWAENNKSRLRYLGKKYREENKERIKDKNKKYYDNNKEIISQKQKRYFNNNPMKYKARYSISNAIKLGKLNKPSKCVHPLCEEKSLQYHWHHWRSYEKEDWFNVIELCFKCHMKMHSILNDVGAKL